MFLSQENINKLHGLRPFGFEIQSRGVGKSCVLNFETFDRVRDDLQIREGANDRATIAGMAR